MMSFYREIFTEPRLLPEAISKSEDPEIKNQKEAFVKSLLTFFFKRKRK
jgi:hypothetical protein